MVKRVFDSVRDDVIYNKEAKAQHSYVDQNPDLVEGIFHIDKTSCVERCRRRKSGDAPPEKNFKIVIFDRRSLYLFDHETRFRKWIVYLTQSNMFDAVIVLAIFFNSAVLAVTDYSDRDNE